MRLCERDRRTVWLRRFTPRPDAYGEPVPAWDVAVPLRVTHQPARAGFEARAEGMRPTWRRLLFYDGPEAVLEGDGICLRAPADAAPDCRVTAVAIWGDYQRIEVEVLSAEQRLLSEA
jgi:hypothetical protein